MGFLSSNGTRYLNTYQRQGCRDRLLNFLPDLEAIPSILHPFTVATKVQRPYQRRNISLSTLFSSYQINAHFLYSIIIYMLHYNPQHVSSSTLLIFRRTNCIITASGIVTLCIRPYSMPVDSGLQSALNRHTVQAVYRE